MFRKFEGYCRFDNDESIGDADFNPLVYNGVRVIQVQVPVMPDFDSDHVIPDFDSHLGQEDHLNVFCS